MTTERMMVRAGLSGMVSAFAVMSAGLLSEYVWLGIGVGAVIMLVVTLSVRCPRCGANAYRQESAVFGEMHSILNTSCYRCHLLFTKEYDATADTEASRWTAERPWWRPLLAPASMRRVAFCAHLLLASVAMGIAYVNVHGALASAMSWDALTIRGTLLGCAYIILVVLLQRAVLLFEGEPGREP